MLASDSVPVVTRAVVGALLAGKYRLEASIGRGGMGEVFAASHIGTGKRVAVKVVSRMDLGELLMARLHREAIAAGRITSEFIPQVFDVDRTAEGELFLVMELLRGQSLADRLKDPRGALAWLEVRQIGEDLLCGLIDAHAAGVTHRDLKPGNIFLETVTTGGHATRQRARILDFGVCKLDTPDTEKLTITGEAVGTISYMAPEQIRGASKVDGRADLYSLAIVVFEALTGRLPYDAQGQVALIASKLERDARRLMELVPIAVPGDLDAILAKALARKPEDRFASAEELLRAWRALGPATTTPRAAAIERTVEPMLAPSIPRAGLTTGTLEHGALRSRASRAGLVVAACALVAASAVLVAALLMRPAVTSTARAPIAPSASEEAPSDVAPTAPSMPASSAQAPAADVDPSSAARAVASAAVAGVKSSRGFGSRAPRPKSPAPARHPAAAGAPHITTEPRY